MPIQRVLILMFVDDVDGRAAADLLVHRADLRQYRIGVSYAVRLAELRDVLVAGHTHHAAHLMNRISSSVRREQVPFAPSEASEGGGQEADLEAIPRLMLDAARELRQHPLGPSRFLIAVRQLDETWRALQSAWTDRDERDAAGMLPALYERTADDIADLRRTAQALADGDSCREPPDWAWENAIRWYLARRLGPEIDAFRADALVVGGDILFERFTDAVIRAVASLKADHPTLRLGLHRGGLGGAGDGCGQSGGMCMGLRELFDDSIEMAGLVARLSQ